MAGMAMPAVFVVLWSTGFIGAKLGLPYSPPATFLAVRFLITALLITAAALAMRAPWPRDPWLVLHLTVAGFLINTVYLGGVYAAIGAGVGAGTSALIVSLQPVIVAAIAAPLLGERVRLRQWVGLLLGLFGCALVIWPKLGGSEASAVGIAFCVLGLAGITAGTLYQKRYCSGADLRTGNTVQFWSAAITTAAPALLLESPSDISWTPTFLFALFWLVVVLSLGAMTLLYRLIRRGAASRVSALFFLVPPTTAAQAWLMFGERLSLLQLAGMAVCGVGVALVTAARR
jgi:drug/metabolite transporter (DMT)-like permease